MKEGPPPQQTLLLLVGSNPLPNYLAACALRTRRVVLVHTKETKNAKERLRQQLKEALGEETAIDEQFVDDATCGTSVRRALDPLVKGAEAGSVLLNYTGGTKVMAAHARMAFMTNGGRPEHASYLDEGGRQHQPRLRFDDGTSKSLVECHVPVSLPVILALHDITHKAREPKAPAPMMEDACEILCRVLENPDLTSELYRESDRLKKLLNPAKALSEPFRSIRYGLKLTVPEFPTPDLLTSFQTRAEKESWLKQWYFFIGGGWLEDWLGQQIGAISLSPKPEITVGVNAYRGDKVAQLEVDVAVLCGYRSYFASCTTDRRKYLCKSRLFEMAVRSRQLGGDLARAALVCLADDSLASALQSEVDDVWGASNTIRVFGLSDLRAWSDCNGKKPNRDSLKKWLES